MGSQPWAVMVVRELIDPLPAQSLRFCYLHIFNFLFVNLKEKKRNTYLLSHSFLHSLVANECTLIRDGTYLAYQDHSNHLARAEP